jgi:DNA-binding MarR family transcriptional regulator
MARTKEITELIYDFLQHYIDYSRKPPTIREIAAGCFVSVGTVMRHLDKLEASGLIEREPTHARSIVLPQFDREKRK